MMLDNDTDRQRRKNAFTVCTALTNCDNSYLSIVEDTLSEAAECLLDAGIVGIIINIYHTSVDNASLLIISLCMTMEGQENLHAQNTD